ncbi:hypothetical protein FRC01_009613 [Tulasnella sp. 417]|nr:hypothetical protein FRC01_009613 [Tulasnella sp. 417]
MALPAVPATSQHSSGQSLPVKQPPEDARRVKELLLFDDIPETKLDKLHRLLHFSPDATESEAQDWAEPLELPENRVLAWFRYQRKSGASHSPSPPKYEEVDQLNTPETLVKHELSPEATVSDPRSNSRGVDSPVETGMEMDEDEQAEIQVSGIEVVPSPQEHRPASKDRTPPRTPPTPSINQLPTPADSASTSPTPSDAGQTFVQQQEPVLSPSHMQVTNSQRGLSTSPRAGQADVEDGEIPIEGRDDGSSSPPMVGLVATIRTGSSYSAGAPTGNSFPVTTPRATWSPSAPLASPRRPSTSRGDGHIWPNSWDDTRHSPRGDSSRQQHLPSRNGPPPPSTGYGKGKGREILAGSDEVQQEPRFVEQHGVGPLRDRPRPPRLQTHPYRVPSLSYHRDRHPPSASISDSMTPSTSRSMTSPSTAGTSMSPPPRNPDSYRIVQAVTMAFKGMPVTTARMEVDSHAEGAPSSTHENVKKILEINSWALGAAKSLGVSVEGFASRGSMLPPPNPPSSSNFRT